MLSTVFTKLAAQDTLLDPVTVTSSLIEKEVQKPGEILRL